MVDASFSILSRLIYNVLAHVVLHRVGMKLSGVGRHDEKENLKYFCGFLDIHITQDIILCSLAIIELSLKVSSQLSLLVSVNVI